MTGLPKMIASVRRLIAVVKFLCQVGSLVRMQYALGIAVLDRPDDPVRIAIRGNARGGSRVSESASNAYTLSFSVTAYSTLCIVPEIDTPAKYIWFRINNAVYRNGEQLAET